MEGTEPVGSRKTTTKPRAVLDSSGRAVITEFAQQREPSRHSGLSSDGCGAAEYWYQAATAS
jgi:hypothetical protein